MPKEGPIIIIEDDKDDQLLLKSALRNAEVWNPLVFFTNGPDAYEYLKSLKQQPFLIFCDVNLPRQNGIEFKTQLDADTELRARSTPFIFYTTYVSQYAINEAYKNLTVQGFFQKENNFEDFNNVIKVIVQYWKLCRQPVNDSKAITNQVSVYETVFKDTKK
ncbi:MAG: response regulator [Ferruginibacter sp.]